MVLLVTLLAGLVAGSMNALAGGGSFVTFPSLLFAGLTPIGANITSTVALFPGQITTALAGRRMVGGAGGLSFRALFAISLAGGALGGLLLLATPPDFFAHLVPWLVLFATAVFTWGSFFRRSGAGAARLGARGAGAAQFAISIYGGYFGGGIGFLMLAALTMTGLAVRNAGATKNALAGVMNAAAVAIFLFSGQIVWLEAAVLGAGAIAGGYFGVFLLKRVRESVLRGFVVALGAALTVGLFLHFG